MSNLVGDTLCCSAHRLIMGAKMTTTGVLLRKAEMKETAGIMRNCTRRTANCPFGKSQPNICSSSPDRRTPSLTRKSRATVIIPLLEKPSKTSFGVSTPAHRKTTAPEKSTMPGRNASLMSATSSSRRTMVTNAVMFSRKKGRKGRRGRDKGMEGRKWRCKAARA